MKKFKIGVSNWVLTFANGQIIEVKNLFSENVTMFSSGKASIRLSNATFEEDVVDLLKEGIEVIDVKQVFELRDMGNIVVENIEYNYQNMALKRVQIASETDSVGEFNIVLKSQ